jgi:hypothetical protein
MEAMKRLVLLICCTAAMACAADLAGVRAVYLMPMARGLDQHLANRLTGEKVFQVVTDPKAADAIFSDRIGEAFRAQLERLLPAEKAAPAKPAKEADAAPSKLITETENKLDSPGLNSAFGRGKGTLFLVDPKTSTVLWSVYEEPSSGDGKTLDRSALEIVTRLKKDLAAKK